ncbi:MAG: peptide chain release factor N(5)-glutamine methyltransferase [Clostridia bacterium]|nr:peptide chain release factor N(5)-glutamine methyltransferase [Clostridia bacterium]
MTYKKMTIFEAYNDCKRQLQAAGIEEYVFESKQIIRHITGYTNAQILTKYTQSLSNFQRDNLTAIIKQRLIRYPLQYIIGKWNFFGREFFVGPGVLIPRSDTETLIDVCLESIKKTENPRVLDLCAGTGCIGITIKGERNDARVTLVEKFDEALTYTNKNVAHNNVDVNIVKGDVLKTEGADGPYDLIVSNPPYINDSDMSTLQPEVTFEPTTALAGGSDGLDFYRHITKEYKQYLSKYGTLAFEVGINQADAVAEIMKENGFLNVQTRKDYCEIDRVVFGTVD